MSAFAHGQEALTWQEAPQGSVTPACVWLSVQLPAGVDCQLLQLPEELTQGPIPGAAWWQLPVTVPMVGNGPATGLQPQSMPSAIAAQQPSFPSVPPPPPSTRVNGRVWALAQDPCGSRRVQQALEEAADDQERAGLAMELRGHVLEALQCPHANHVLQKCIELMPADRVQFVLAELKGHAVGAARHRYGCRVLERLIEHCSSSQTAGLVDEVLAGAQQLCRHTFGNFVIQHILVHGMADQRQKVASVLCADVQRLARHRVASHVVRCALVHCSPKDRQTLALAMSADAGEFADLAHHHCGSFVVREMKRADGRRR
mmetsp:Transcript_56361/g.175040  ORF Transcript_56361/g.175040 Transcript_56361/m.175040 type:complete len:316 (+) Transcript_56361:55-1002(+)